MKILAIETSMGRTSVALALGADAPPFAMRLNDDERQAEHLIPLIAKLMEQARLGFCDLDRIAVCVGPGGFSGVRTGVSAARGIAMAARKSIVGITSFQLMARVFLACQRAPVSDNAFGILAPAGTDLLYCQIFDCEGGHLTKVEALTVAQAHDAFTSRVSAVAGPNREAIARCCLNSLQWDGGEIWPDAENLASFAASLDPRKDLAIPCYVRPPDARPQTGYAMARKLRP